MPAILDRLLEGDPVRIVDIGARDGLDARWERFAEHLDLVAFEPDLAECARLNEAAASLPYPAQFLANALWREESEAVPFHVCAWPVASSIYAPNAAFLSGFPEQAAMLAVQERRTIATTTLDRCLPDPSLQADCLKVDVEGAELDVLLGGEATLSGSLVLDVEVEFAELFLGQPLFADVDSHLRARGWTLLGLRRNSWRRGSGRAEPGFGGQLVSADALYVNRSTFERGLSTHRAVKAAVILAAYQQLDLALSLLDETPLIDLNQDERRELESLLAPRQSLLRRLGIRALGRIDGERRRALADSVQARDASVWHDPGYF